MVFILRVLFTQKESGVKYYDVIESIRNVKTGVSINFKANYHYLKQASLFLFFCKYKLMKMQLRKRKLRLIFLQFLRFYLKTKSKTTICNSNAKCFQCFSFHFSNSSKITNAPKCKILEYAGII